MSNKTKTLVILTPGFPGSEADTTCLPFLQAHVIALNRCYPSLRIIILAFQYPHVAGSYTWRGNDVISFGGRGRGKLHRLLLWTRVWKTLNKLAKSTDVIGLFSLWCTECALIGSRFGRMHKLKHFVWLCGQDAKPGNKYVRLMRPKPSELIAMSDFLQREFYTNYKVQPAHVIALGVDPADFPKNNSQRDVDILGVGSLIPLKQYDIFLRVVKELKPDAPKAILCGTGPDAAILKQLAEQLQIADLITFAGEVPHDRALLLMQRTKIFLHPSSYEGFGTVCLEALCAGAHVVSFTKPMDQPIDHWHHVRSVDEMAATVKALLNDGNCPHDPVIPFTTDDVARSMMKLYGL